MSTESGKTCGKCYQRSHIQPKDGATVMDKEVELCPLHDGSMAEKLAEALRLTVRNHNGGKECTCSGCAALATYDELQGRIL